MATKSVKVCDLCGRPVEELKNTLKFNEFEYTEICDDCAGKLGKLIAQIQIPPVSQYMKRKARMVEEK